MRYPLPLQQNDTIQVVAPAGSILKGDLDFAEKWCLEQGWKLKVNPEVYSEHFLGYRYAGTDEARASDLQSAIDDNRIKAIWFARGGYGSVKIIDRINFDNLKKHPKYLIGYSDITVFHNHLNNMEVPTVHAVTAKPLSVKYNPDSYAYLAKILKGEFPVYSISKHNLNQVGKVKGTLVGGNLSIIHSLLASPSFINCLNPILFIEDWFEDWYSVDRMLMSLKRSGFLAKIKGLIVGSFTKMDDKDENLNYYSHYDQTTYEVISEMMKEYSIPSLYEFPAGHEGHNLPLIMGTSIELNVHENGGEVKLLKSKNFLKYIKLISRKK